MKTGSECSEKRSQEKKPGKSMTQDGPKGQCRRRVSVRAQRVTEGNRMWSWPPQRKRRRTAELPAWHSKKTVAQAPTGRSAACQPQKGRDLNPCENSLKREVTPKLKAPISPFSYICFSFGNYILKLPACSDTAFSRGLRLGHRTSPYRQSITAT